MRADFLSLAASVLLLPGVALAQETADMVHLRFDWPVGTRVVVEAEWSRLNQTPERRDSLILKSRYHMNVLEHPRGRLVEIDSFAPISAGDTMPPEVEGLLAGIGSFMPSYVVSPTGDFLELGDPAGYKARIDSIFASLFQGLDTLPLQVQELLARATSVDALSTSAAESWNLMVGTWVDAEWEVGMSYEYAAEEPFYLIPGSVVLMNYEFAAIERVPCIEGDDELDCVLLGMRSAPDSASLEQVMQALLRTVVPDEADVAESLRGMLVLNELHVVTRPESLKPYYTEYVKYVEVPADAGREAPIIRATRQSASYSYPLN